MRRSGRGVWVLALACAWVSVVAAAETVRLPLPAAVAVPTTVVRAAKGKRFHKPGCKAARDGLAVVSLTEALAEGLTACRRCLDRSARRKRVAEAPSGLEALDAHPAPVETAAPRGLEALGAHPAPVETAAPPARVPAAPASPSPAPSPAPIVGAHRMPWDDPDAVIQK